MDPENSLCNGTRIMIICMALNMLEGRILSGDFAGEKRFIPRIKFNTSPEDFPYIVTRLQFPVRLCFSMTVNKSQGQSFGTVAVDLRSQVFSHGQFYVAMSRVKDVRQLFLLVQAPHGPVSRPVQVQNIVYPEVLIRTNQN